MCDPVICDMKRLLQTGDATEFEKATTAAGGDKSIKKQQEKSEVIPTGSLHFFLK